MPQKTPYIYLSFWFAGFTVLFTIMVLTNRLVTFDHYVQNLLYIDSSYFKKISRGITSLADTKVLALLSFLLLFILLLHTNLRRHIAYFFLVMSGGVVITFIMKLTIERERPEEIVFIDFWGLGNHLISYSYPSGHAVKALLFFWCVIYLLGREIRKVRLRRSITTFCIILVLLIGIGQILLQNHYASDVIGGYLVGMTWLLFCTGIYQFMKRRYISKKEETYILNL